MPISPQNININNTADKNEFGQFSPNVEINAYARYQNDSNTGSSSFS
jgi:hypothetical protein